MRLVVLSPQHGWHYVDLCRAAAEINCGGVGDLEIGHFDFGSLAGGISNGGPHFNVECDVVFVRTMPAGSLEQIVFRMDLLQRKFVAGTRIVNSPKCIEASVDKYLSLSLLAAASLPVPDTRVSQTIEQALLDFESLGGEVVVKPIFGSMGQGIGRLSDLPAAKSYFESAVGSGSVIYQQQFINHGGSDIRLLVIKDEVWGMQRTNEIDWITNISRGGTGAVHKPTVAEAEMALVACKAVGASIAGVDLVYDQNGNPYVLEVNAAVGWKEISRVLNVDFARLILYALMDQGGEGQTV